VNRLLSLVNRDFRRDFKSPVAVGADSVASKGSPECNACGQAIMEKFGPYLGSRVGFRVYCRVWGFMV
jgi:hypothetical protein